MRSKTASGLARISIAASRDLIAASCKTLLSPRPSDGGCSGLLGGKPKSKLLRRPHSPGKLRREGLRILGIEARGLHLGAGLPFLRRRHNQPERILGRVVENLTEHLGSYQDAAILGHRDCVLTGAHAPEAFEKKVEFPRIDVFVPGVRREWRKTP